MINGLQSHKIVYVGLGGNIGNTVEIFEGVLQEFRTNKEIWNLRCSSFYRSEPIAAEIQRDFVNAVCAFETTFKPDELLLYLQALEYQLGQSPKPKNSPRKIDLDILLFGDYHIKNEVLSIPHPYWRQRLFVLLPLRELTSSVWIQNGKSGGWLAIDPLIKEQDTQKIRLLCPNEKVELWNL